MLVRFICQLSVLIASFLFLSLGNASAIECSDDQLLRARDIVDIAGRQLVDGMLGGINIETSLNDCLLEPESTTFVLNMTVGWNGAIWRRNYYEVTGELLTTELGSEVEFRKISANDSAEKLSFWANVGTIALDISGK